MIQLNSVENCQIILICICLLAENNLIGKIPPEISILRFVDILNLGGNCLIGTIPSEMGWMTNLQQLNLEYNGLSGYLPDEFFNMSSLTRLNLSWQGGNERNCTSSKGELIELQYNLRDDVNYGLEGEILKKIGSLRHLKEILVEGNYFSGEITPDIKNLKQLGKGITSVLTAYFLWILSCG